MRLKGIVITLLAGSAIFGSCAEDAYCPVTTVKPEYYFAKRKIKGVVKPKGKRKPTPSLIHITRVNYKPNATR